MDNFEHLLAGMEIVIDLLRAAPCVTVVITSRTFNDAPEGSFGQSLPGIESAFALSPSVDGVLSVERVNTW